MRQTVFFGRNCFIVCIKNMKYLYANKVPTREGHNPRSSVTLLYLTRPQNKTTNKVIKHISALLVESFALDQQSKNT